MSRQPISHALQLLKQQKLVEENGRRGLIVSEIDAARVRELYQVRSALDALAARLAAKRILVDISQRRAAEQALAAGLAGTVQKIYAWWLEQLRKQIADGTLPDVVRREPIRNPTKVGRNEPCPCGSGKKFKQCHGSAGRLH